MQFTKEAIALAKDSIEAIKFLAEKEGEKCPECKGSGKVWRANYLNQSDCTSCKGTGKISQQEMIRQAQESIAKKEPGKYQLVYKKDRRTIVAEPREWEWKPKVGDFYYQDSGNRRLLLVRDENEAEDIVQRNLTKRFALIPLLRWEDDIEPILKRMKYRLEITHSVGGKQACSIYLLNQHKVTAWGKDRQTSVVLALIELRKEMEK
ncbi:hypothetical protein ES703_32427 [subsurface metagenome]